jgi:hypothetical protein
MTMTWMGIPLTELSDEELKRAVNSAFHQFNSPTQYDTFRAVFHEMCSRRSLDDVAMNYARGDA